ncbi:MAG: peptide deformylase [Pseudomonadota bacterium]
MAILPIVTWPDPRLETRCAPVETEMLDDLVRDMLETMYNAKGRGLAAPQVGVLKRLFVMDCGWKDGEPAPMVMINPTIMAAERSMVTGDEGCLSIPGILVPVARYAAVTLQWTDEKGDIHMGDFDGFEARCIQHEFDHLNGVVTLDHHEGNARAEFERLYREGAA